MVYVISTKKTRGTPVFIMLKIEKNAQKPLSCREFRSNYIDQNPVKSSHVQYPRIGGLRRVPRRQQVHQPCEPTPFACQSRAKYLPKRQPLAFYRILKERIPGHLSPKCVLTVFSTFALSTEFKALIYFLMRLLSAVIIWSAINLPVAPPTSHKPTEGF